MLCIQKVQEEEKHLQGTVNDLNQSLTDSQQGSQSLQEKLTQYHKRLNAAGKLVCFSVCFYLMSSEVLCSHR